MNKITAKDEDSHGNNFSNENKEVEIKSEITPIIDSIEKLIEELKEGYNHLLDIIDEDYAERPSGFGYTKQEKLNKINRARNIYLQHFGV